MQSWLLAHAEAMQQAVQTNALDFMFTNRCLPMSNKCLMPGSRFLSPKFQKDLSKKGLNRKIISISWTSFCALLVDWYVAEHGALKSISMQVQFLRLPAKQLYICPWSILESFGPWERTFRIEHEKKHWVESRRRDEDRIWSIKAEPWLIRRSDRGRKLELDPSQRSQGSESGSRDQLLLFGENMLSYRWLISD